MGKRCIKSSNYSYQKKTQDRSFSKGGRNIEAIRIIP